MRVGRFRLIQSLDELVRLSPAFEPRLRVLLQESIGQLRGYVTGNWNIFALRERELSLTANASRLLSENSDLSQRLTVTVDRLVSEATTDIKHANAEAESVVRFSSTIVVLAVALSLISSGLIVWLYVSQNLIARLTSLSDRMLALARGDLRSPLPDGGTDEIGQMAESLAVFRLTAIQMEEANFREITEARRRLRRSRPWAAR